MNIKPLILVADDHKEFTEFLLDTLIEEYEILIAENGRIALSLLFNEPVQLVISDVMMPIMDGFELCSNIKKSYDLSHIPVILLTAKTTVQSRIEGLELGADVYIDKPFSPRQLKAQISSLMNNRLKIREYYAKSPLVHLKSMAYTKIDELFLDKLNSFIVENLDNSELNIVDLAKHMHMSRPTLYRKVNAITNLTPKEIINITRLKKAACLLLEGLKISDIILIVGFSSASYFTQSFHRQFKMTPSEYLKDHKNHTDIN